jgi:biotin carboxyl carrier protein
MVYTYEYGGQTYTVRLERAPDGSYTAVIDDRTLPLTAQPLNDGGWLLTLSGQQFTVYGAALKGERFVHVGGQSFTVTVPDSRPNRRASRAGGDLTAQMPGQIVDVLVSTGASVEAGQTLVILEAMKMQIRVAAPIAGRVTRLLVNKGDIVERGQLLAELETAS